MIHVFHASAKLQNQFDGASNERELLRLVVGQLSDYLWVTAVKHAELDIAFAATGGITQWVMAERLAVNVAPKPARSSIYGDILVEQANGFASLSTPMGFIPLIDVVQQQYRLLPRLQS